MTNKEHITITPTRNNIQFDIKQGNQSRWFSVDIEIAKELYQKLGDVLDKEEEWSVDWIEREMAAFLNKKNVEHSHSVQRDIGSSMYGTYGTERHAHTKEETNE